LSLFIERQKERGLGNWQVLKAVSEIEEDKITKDEDNFIIVNFIAKQSI
jgi:hypothetical protein